MKQILITGGAGYIGSHALRLLAKRDDLKITVVDNLSKGFAESIEIIKKEATAPITFYQFDLTAKSAYEKLEKKKFDAVLHFAAFIEVNESTQHPLMYFSNNLESTSRILEYMKETGSQNLIFSSTSAVYSRDAKLPFTEKSEVVPENPYAESKLMDEKIINWCRKAWGLNALVFRYFNVCGCSLDAKIGFSKIPASWIMVNAVRGALGLQQFEVTCGKVDTPDGTTIRDYINILDIVSAHELALDAMLDGKKGELYNLGIGKGHSVMEIVNLVKKVTGKEFEVEIGEPRAGELPICYCTPEKFSKEFGWKPRYTLEQAVESFATWFTKRPNGYSY